MSVIMIVAFMPSMAFATEKNWDDNGKFKVELKSGATTATAEVFDDYSVSAKVNGNTVDASDVTLKVNMKNVASLGVDENGREYEKKFTTGITGKTEVSLLNHFTNLFKFTGATVNGKVDDKEFSYTISKFDSKGTETSPQYELTATPSGDVREAWWTLTKKVTAVQDGVDDSKIVVPAGAYLQIGENKVKFAKEYTLNPSAGTAVEEGTIVSETGKALVGSMTAELYLPAGTVLKLSSSTATLKNSIYIRTDVEIPSDKVEALKGSITSNDQNKIYGIIYNLVQLTDATIGNIDGKPVKVHVLNKFDVTVDGTKTEYAYGDTFNLEPAGAGYVWKCENEVVKPGTITVTKDMTLIKTQDSTPVTPGGGGGPAVVPPATDNVTNNAADKNTTADLTPAVKDNKAETTVDAKTADKIVEKALENKSEEIIVDAAGNNTVASSEVGIPEKTVKEIAEKTDANLVIKTDNGKVDLDKAAVKAVADQAGTTGTVKLIVETVKTDADICHVNLKLVTSNGAVTDFKGGNVKVTINLTKELAAKELVCVYIDDNGIYTLVNGQKNADGTYTFTTGHFSEYAVMAKEEADKKIAEQLDTMIKDVNLKVRTSKTAKKNIKAVVSGDVKAITDAGYTVKYKFYRSEKKASKYVAKATKAGKTYVNTAGKKGTKYYYKAKALVYDGDKLVGQTVLKQCKYGARTWSK